MALWNQQVPETSIANNPYCNNNNEGRYSAEKSKTYSNRNNSRLLEAFESSPGHFHTGVQT